MGTPWKMPLAVMGRPTGDKRMFDPGVLSHLATPLPWRYVSQDAGAHTQARVVGTINKIEYADGDGAPMGSGEFFDGEDAPEATRAAAQEALFLARKAAVGPSVDLDSSDSEGRDYTPKMTLADAKAAADCGCSKEHEPEKIQAVTKGRIRGATLVHIPAFAELAGKATFGAPDGQADPNVNANAGATDTFSVAEFVTLHEAAESAGLLADGSDEEYAIDPNVGGGVDREKLGDSDFIDPHGRRFPIVTPKDVSDAVHSYGRAKPLIPVETFRRRLTGIAHRKGQAFVDALPDSWDSLTASAAPGLLDRPPAEWFANPNLDAPTPLTITDDGRVFGHLAAWGTCHTGIGDSCVTAPKSRTGYAYFHTGEAVTADGRRIPVGRLTYGGGHARHHLGYAAAAEHYDSTSAVGAYVRAGEDAHGIWVAGAMAPTATDSAYATMRAAPLSGDWRRVAGNLELVAALHVNTPGFPVPRAVMASGVPQALTAAGVLHPVDPETVEGVAGLVRQIVGELRRERSERRRVMTAALAEVDAAEAWERIERYAAVRDELIATVADFGEE